MRSVITFSAARFRTVSTNPTHLKAEHFSSARARLGPLPIAILHDGRVFVQPTAIEIVEALGMNAAKIRAIHG